MVLAPQLRQSLEMLQVPVLELRTLLQKELEQNPTLEEKIEALDPIEVEPGPTQVDEVPTPEELKFEEDFKVLAQLDDEWRDYYQQSQSNSGYSRSAEEKRQFFMDSITREESLQEHLMEQLSMAALADYDHQICELLIGSIDNDGYLTMPLEELAATVGFDLKHMNNMLGLVQEFDPIGVGARDLRECLLIQLKRLGRSQGREAELVRDHLEDLGSRRYPQIARALKIPVEEVQALAHFIGTLEPRPGRAFSSESTTYVLPEIAVKKVDGEYTVVLNEEHIPHLRISSHYRKLMEDQDTKREVKSYIRERIRSGMFLMKSIDQRQQTIHRIASDVVQTQKEFLDHGIGSLKPLTMAEVANRLGIHETTVSRAIANKYMTTPRGTFEMKYFFTPGYTTDSGESVSNKTIKDTILRFVQEENPEKPLSDQAIAEMLKEQGVKVARRTVAKYREELRILPSNLRKAY